MSSNPATAALSKANVTLIREVLRGAGLRGADPLASSDVESDASIFLTAEFRRGARTRSSLSEALARRTEQFRLSSLRKNKR
jgi:hypothetical protein